MATDSSGRRSRPSVIVVGAGLSGLAAACELSDLGCRVTLLEKRGFVGGRAYSFQDTTTGLEVDNGQHVFMKCCTSYVDFLKKLGVYSKTYVQDRMRVHIVDSVTGTSTLTSASLPSPFHILPSFLRFRHLSWIDKALVLYVSLRMIALGSDGRRALDGQPFYEWLREHHQSDAAISSFWNVIILPTLNDDVYHVSANQAIMVFQEGLFREAHSAGIGYSRVGLSTLLGDEAVSYIKERGGEVMLKRNVESFLLHDGHISGVALADGGVLTGDQFISAVPYHVLTSILPGQLQENRFFNKASKLTSSPIVNVHIWYDRPVLDLDFAGFINSRVHWVFNKSRIFGQGGRKGQYLSLSLSGAREYIGMPKEAIQETFIEEMQRILPKARAAHVLNVSVVKEPNATFSPAPNALRYRLPTRTPIDNLFLAGEWTDTDWPSTMEGAVRSGLAAAQEIVESSR